MNNKKAEVSQTTIGIIVVLALAFMVLAFIAAKATEFTVLFR